MGVLCQSFENTISSATHSDFIYCDPPYIGRHVDYYDSWDEELEVALHSALVKSQSILCCQHGIIMITVQTNISSRCGMTAKSSHGNIFIM